MSWKVGEIYSVSFQRVDGSELAGRVVLRDLRGIVENTPSEGVRGPQSPQTQFLLAAGAAYMNGDISEFGPAAPDRAVRPLPGLYPVTSWLGINQRALENRWDRSGWQEDLVSFILYSHLADRRIPEALYRMDDWRVLPLGALVRLLAHQQIPVREDKYFRLGELITMMNPESPAVQAARRRYRANYQDIWAPKYVNVLNHYGLRANSDDIRTATWAFRSLVVSEGHDAMWGGALPSARSSLSANAILMMLAGVVVDHETGERLSVEEIKLREPRS